MALSITRLGAGFEKIKIVHAEPNYSGSINLALNKPTVIKHSKAIIKFLFITIIQDFPPKLLLDLRF